MTDKLTKSARGEECTLRLHPFCNQNPETTVLAHVGRGAGMGRKNHSISGVYACSACHDVIDGRIRAAISKEELLAQQIDALGRTHLRMIENGVIKL